MPPKPYKSSTVHISAECRWIRARALRIGAERRLGDEDGDASLPKRIGSVTTTESEELRRRLPALRGEEERLRAEIDQRLDASAEAGRETGLQAMCREQSLVEFERTVLLLALLPAFGSEFVDLIDQAMPLGLGSSPVMVETVWAFLGHGIPERVKSREALRPTAPLLREGLISLSIGKTAGPTDLAGAVLEISDKAFQRIVGVQDGGE